jgi:hypothetical protein
MNTVENHEMARQEALKRAVPDYAMLFFDHLYSEYLTLKSSFKDEEVAALLEGIHQKRLNKELTWSDIYTFDLALVEVRPPESLIRKAYDARAKYRSISGQKEYDEYLASKPPDLAGIQVAPEAEPPQPEVIIELALRADIRYLLSKVYLYYALLPVRESLREQLTWRALKITLLFVGLVVVAILINLGGVFVFSGIFSAVFGLTVATVALAGIVGGCVSMLQRIQNAPSEGDALFNLASLTNGWIGLSLSPVYGAIFASLLFVLFAGGILEGTVFPKINTPKRPPTGSAAQIPTAATETFTRQGSGTSPATVGLATNQATGNQEPSASPILSATPSASPTVTPSASPSPTATKESDILQIQDFLRETGPADGVSYALLIIWSFIAGFAERLVPDTLNRMVAKNAAIQGNNS